MRSIATVTTRQPEGRTAAIPAPSSQRYMITPPCTLPPLFASAMRIQRLSSERESDGGLGCTAPGSLGCSRQAERRKLKEAGCQGSAGGGPPASRPKTPKRPTGGKDPGG